MLDKIPEHGGHFKITKQADGSIWIASRKWPTKYYYQQKWDHRNCRAAEGDPDEQGEWFLERCPGKTECYYMSARRWKGTEFAYVESNANRNVKGKAGKPGPEGQWILTKAAK